jgi:hypothetical protein
VFFQGHGLQFALLNLLGGSPAILLPANITDVHHDNYSTLEI